MIRLQCVDENIREIFIEPHGERFRRLLNLLVKEIPSHLIYRT